MRTYEELKEMLCRELDGIVKKDELSAGSLDTVHKLTDTIKNIDKIEMLEEDGYSQRRRYSRDGGWEARGVYGTDHSYDDDGNSYRGRKRDSMGRYSRDDDGIYSRADGKDHAIRKLHEMMDDAMSDKEREAIKRCISTLEST